MSEVKIVEAPPGIEGSGFFATSMDKVVGLARSHSLHMHLQLLPNEALPSEDKPALKQVPFSWL